MNKHSRVCANIDLSAVMHTKIMAVIKADGYGHGAVPIAKEIEHLDYVYGYAAATVEEGMILRNNGIQKPILILGYIFPDQYEEVIQAEICPSVFTLEMAKELSAAAEKVGKDCRMHFAVDTGMSRIGYQVTEEAADEMAQIAKLPHMIVEGIFTHFAKADEYDKTFTKEQIQKFKKMIAMMEDRGVSIPVKHCSNSAGIAEIREANMDMVRAGITLYGLWPSEEVDQNSLDLKPVMDQLRWNFHHKARQPHRNDPGWLCRWILQGTFQYRKCPDPRKTRTNLRKSLYGSVHGRCDGYPGCEDRG